MKKLMLTVAAALAAAVLLTGCNEAPTTPTSATPAPEPEPTAPPIEGSWKLVDERATIDHEESPTGFPYPDRERWLTFEDGIYEDRNIITGRAKPVRTLGTYFVDEMERRIYVTVKYASGDNTSTYIIHGVLIFAYSLFDEGQTLKLLFEGLRPVAGEEETRAQLVRIYWTLERGTIPS